MFIRIDFDRWYSQQPTRSTSTSSLAEGKVVIADRKPFRIDRVDEIVPERWPQQYVDEWLKQRMPDAGSWGQRPMRVYGVWQNPGADTRPHSTVAPAQHMWSVLPEHYSVCHRCLELPPCRHVHTEAVMERAADRLDKEMSILPGVCHGCREPITKRQKSFTFPGPNLIRPDLGDDTAIFHTRSACYGDLDSYDKRWAAAEEGRSRLFYCSGTLTEHHDGSSQCSEAGCLAKGAHKDLVQHALWVRHHPRMREALGCWCLSGLI